MKAAATRLIDTLFMSAARFVPSGLAHHLLWVVHQEQKLSDRWGFHIRPIHYYDPVPDFRAIDNTKLATRASVDFIEKSSQDQLAMIALLAKAFRAELDDIATTKAFNFTNRYFTGLDACAYYAIVRHLKPKRVVEIGSGYSTQIAWLAAERNRLEGVPTDIVCIEPYPEPRLTESKAKFRLIEKQVQDVPLQFFEELSRGDVLMIDSSHVVRTGGDVCYEFLEVLPRLRPGVWIHVHDIFLPWDYPAKWIFQERRAYNEQYMLQALLTGCSWFDAKLANHWLVMDHRKEVDALCPPGATQGVADEQLGSSFWMCRAGGS